MGPGAACLLGESLRGRFGEPQEVFLKHEALKLLGSDTRLNILKHLDKRRMTVSELARTLDLNKSTVHEHLAKLVEAGLIRRDESPEREWVYYELTKTARHVLQPASARFVLLLGTAIAAGIVALVAAQFFLLAGQGMALQADPAPVAAGEAHTWTLDLSQPGLLGMRESVADASLFLLTPEQAAEWQLTRHIPPGAQVLGPAQGLAPQGHGSYSLRSSLDAGVHYILATRASGDGAIFPIRSEAVHVQPSRPTLLVGVDPPQFSVAVRFHDQPVTAGVVQAVDAQGRELAEVPVLNGKAVMALQQPAAQVSFRFKPAQAGSSFAEALGSLQAPEPKVAFEPQQVPLLYPSDIRVLVDDPLQGPRSGAPVSLVRIDGKPVAQGTTDASGASALQVRATEPGVLIVKAGDVEVGRVTIKPGLRLWIQPGPFWEGDRIRVRALMLGQEPQSVAGVSILLGGREVGITDDDGWLPLQFGLGGQYHVEARREGYVPSASDVNVLARTGYALSGTAPSPGFAAASAARVPAPGEEPHVEVADDRVLLGQATQVRALLRNGDDLPRVVRAELRVDGAMLAVRGVEIPAGASAWVNFDYAPSSLGMHTVQVNDLSGQSVEALSALPGSSPAARSVPGIPIALAMLGVAAAALVGASRPR